MLILCPCGEASDDLHFFDKQATFSAFFREALDRCIRMFCAFTVGMTQEDRMFEVLVTPTRMGAWKRKRAATVTRILSDRSCQNETVYECVRVDENIVTDRNVVRAKKE